MPGWPDRAARPFADRLDARGTAWSISSASRRSTCSAAALGEDGLRASWTSASRRRWRLLRGVPAAPRRHRHRDPLGGHGRFDPPIDEGFQTNLFGAMNLYRGVLESGSRPASGARLDRLRRRRARRASSPRPRSTTASTGAPKAELALQARGDVEARVASPGDARRLHGQGRKEHSRAGPHDGRRGCRAATQGLGDEAPRRSTGGRARARSAGPTSTRSRRRWASAPSRSSPTGGAAAVDRSPLDHRERPRPSAPGWIDGFKMADPIDPRVRPGADPGVPRHPEGIVDIIPVDMVVNAMLAVAATPPEPRARVLPRRARHPEPAAVPRALPSTCASTSRRIRCPSAGRGEHKVPEWSFPGNLTRRAHDRPRGAPSPISPRQVVTHLPKSKRMRDAGLSRGPRQGARRLRQAVLGPVRRVHRGRGHLHRRPDARAVGFAHA